MLRKELGEEWSSFLDPAGLGRRVNLSAGGGCGVVVVVGWSGWSFSR